MHRGTREAEEPGVVALVTSGAACAPEMQNRPLVGDRQLARPQLWLLLTQVPGSPGYPDMPVSLGSPRALQPQDPITSPHWPLELAPLHSLTPPSAHPQLAES